jgi:multicomponent Na+:H+ antiporter subunit C
MVLIVLFLIIALFGLGISQNIIKTIMLINILQTGVILLFISYNYRRDLVAPIVTEEVGMMADPMPQALMITAIVIGASITALALMFSIKIFHHFGTLDWRIIRKRMD